jgi:hypothetical protein
MNNLHLFQGLDACRGQTWCNGLAALDFDGVEGAAGAGAGGAGF